uniref:host attachment protein n=1 Tax=Hydrogenimonas sp. TaxID=2231112 RepID=UPI002609F6A2
LDLIDAKDYVVSHWKVNDIVTDQAGQFKGGSQGRGEFTQGSIGDRHELEKRVETEVIEAIAQDISDALAASNAAKWYLGLPETIFDRVMEKVSANVKESLFMSIKKDLVKENKNKLVELFQKKL